MRMIKRVINCGGSGGPARLMFRTQHQYDVRIGEFRRLSRVRLDVDQWRRPDPECAPYFVNVGACYLSAGQLRQLAAYVGELADELESPEDRE